MYSAHPHLSLSEKVFLTDHLVAVIGAELLSWGDIASENTKLYLHMSTAIESAMHTTLYMSGFCTTVQIKQSMHGTKLQQTT